MRIVINLIVVIMPPAAPPDDSRIDQEDGRIKHAGSPEDSEDGVLVRCPRCQWHGIYDDQTRALKALGAHNRKCKRQNMTISPFAYPIKKKR